MTLAKASRTAEVLFQSRRDDNPLIDLSAELEPVNLDEAYAIQEETLHLIGKSGGWKVGPTPTGEPRCAPLPASVFYTSGASLKVPAVGYDVEVETAFTFAQNVVPGMRVEDAIGSVRLAFEMVASRFRNRKGVSMYANLADLQSNAAVILGPEITDWRKVEIGDLAVTLSMDGIVQDLPQKHTGMAETLSALNWLADHAHARGRGLREGDTVITGARIGPSPIGHAWEIRTSVPSLGSVHVEFTR